MVYFPIVTNAISILCFPLYVFVSVAYVSFPLYVFISLSKTTEPAKSRKEDTPIKSTATGKLTGLLRIAKRYVPGPERYNIILMCVSLFVQTCIVRMHTYTITSPTTHMPPEKEIDGRTNIESVCACARYHLF